MAAFACARATRPTARAVMRQQPQDFRVAEQCPVVPSGEGEHLWLEVEKTGLTTRHVVECLAVAAGIKPRDVGFSGIKDRWAVTRQWFSLPWAISRGAQPLVVDTSQLPTDGQLRVCTQQRHTRKLRRGTHDSNAFTLTLRDVQAEQATIEADLERIATEGVPNYFGAQRFGRDGHNLGLARALFAGKRLRRDKRSFALSAARSYLFNQVLDARVRAGTWNTIQSGEAVMLDGSNSMFNAGDENTTTLAQRLAAFDIHPSGPLPGRVGRAVATADAARLEEQVLQPHGELIDGLVGARVDAARRPLRLRPRALTWSWPRADVLQLDFSLPTGCFATVVLRELAVIKEAQHHHATPTERG